MVHKAIKLRIIFFFSILALVVYMMSPEYSHGYEYADCTKKMELIWTGSKDLNCQTKVTEFLSELKNVSNNLIIELVVTPHAQRSSLKDENFIPYEIRCINQGVLMKRQTDSKLIEIRYLGACSGFDSTDWLQIQREFISEHQSWPNNKINSSLFENTNSAVDKTYSHNPTTPKWKQNLVVGATLGFIAGIIAGNILSPDQESKAPNMLLFGFGGSVAGGTFTVMTF